MIDWENTRGKSPTPNGGYKRNMELVLEAADAVIATGNTELIAAYFISVVMYEMYGDEPSDIVMGNRVTASAFNVQKRHTDIAMNKYLEKCWKNYNNSLKKGKGDDDATR